VCFDPADLKPLFVTDHDASSPQAACYRLHEVYELTRVASFALQLGKILAKSIPPP
jgi:hypothetical protein